MKLDFSGGRSIYLQIAESIEDDILRGALGEEEQLPSTTEMAVVLKINPATAAKGVNLLVDEGTVYKKRGIGMFVAEGAAARIRTKRRAAFYEGYVQKLLEEAGRLGITREELIGMIRAGGGPAAAGGAE